VFEGMRAVVEGRAAPAGDLLWGGCLAAAYVVLAGWTFARVHRHAVRTGLVARYSAESLS